MLNETKTAIKRLTVLWSMLGSLVVFFGLIAIDGDGSDGTFITSDSQLESSGSMKFFEEIMAAEN